MKAFYLLQVIAVTQKNNTNTRGETWNIQEQKSIAYWWEIENIRTSKTSGLANVFHKFIALFDEALLTSVLSCFTTSVPEYSKNICVANLRRIFFVIFMPIFEVQPYIDMKNCAFLHDLKTLFMCNIFLFSYLCFFSSHRLLDVDSNPH